MPYTDDPVADFDAYDRENHIWLKKRPICIHCHEHIQDEYAYMIDGEWVCEGCLKHYRKLVEFDGC